MEQPANELLPVGPCTEEEPLCRFVKVGRAERTRRPCDGLDPPEGRVDVIEGRDEVISDVDVRGHAGIIRHPGTDGVPHAPGRPGETMAPFDFDALRRELEEDHPHIPIRDVDVMSTAHYRDVFRDYREFRTRFGDVSVLPTRLLLGPKEIGEDIATTRSGAHGSARQREGPSSTQRARARRRTSSDSSRRAMTAKSPATASRSEP